MKYLSFSELLDDAVDEMIEKRITESYGYDPFYWPYEHDTEERKKHLLREMAIERHRLLDKFIAWLEGEGKNA